MRKITLILGICSTMMLSGCITTTHQISVDEAEFVEPKAFAQPAGELDGKVTILRDSGLLSAIVKSYVSVNETPVAELTPSQKTVIYLPEGKHFFSLKQGVTESYETINLHSKDDAVLRIHADVYNGIGISQIK